MPEGDTVRRTADRLHRALAGHVLLGSDLRVPAFATVDLRGRRVLESSSHGKHLLLRLDGGATTDDRLAGGLTLHTHLRMEGSWRLFRAGKRWGGGPEWQVRVALATADWQAVGYRLPVVEVLPTAEESRAIGHLGPDLLAPDPPAPAATDLGPRSMTDAASDSGYRGVAPSVVSQPGQSRPPGPPPVLRPPWDEAEALRRLAAEPGRPIAEALLDQRNVAGIGNLWALETCFLRGVNPWTPAGEVDLAAMLRLARRMMQHSVADGARQVTTGDPRPGRSHWIYGRAGAPCRRCSTTILLRRPSGARYEREVYWCPSCQPDRRPPSA